MIYIFTILAVLIGIETIRSMKRNKRLLASIGTAFFACYLVYLYNYIVGG